MHKYLESDKDLLAPDILDDVKELLDGDFGDDRILKDIYRACKNGEVISNYERKYVRDLTERYLRNRRMSMDPAPYSDDGSANGSKDGGDSDAVFDVDLLSGASGPLGSKKSRRFKGKRRKQQSDDGSVRLISSTAKKTSKSKLVIAISAGAILLVALGAGALMSATTPVTPGVLPNDNSSFVPVADPDALVPAGQLYVKTDLLRYSIGDFISISGWAGDAVAGEPVQLSITNAQGQTVWSESVDSKSDGIYSTLAIAGGAAGWDAGGTFSISATAQGDTVTAEFEISG